MSRTSRVTTLPPPARLWDDPEIQPALRNHDMAAVFGYLTRHGYSQRKIGELTGQSQPEISAVVHGRRITGYATLSRIADGLAIPRGRLGLSWCCCPPQRDGDGDGGGRGGSTSGTGSTGGICA